MKDIRTFVVSVIMVLGLSVQANATTYTDQAAFTTALAGLSTSTDNFGSYPLGSIANNQTLGAFTYSYDSTATQPGIASNGSGGQALGDTDPSGTGVFVGGESVTLKYAGANQLIAFGAVFSYAPNFEPIPEKLYLLSILDGTAAGTNLGNLSGLDERGGTFFLGFIGDASSVFSMVKLASLTTDAYGDPYLTPAYQVDTLIYGSETAASVPEPSTLILLTVGVSALIPLMRNQQKNNK